MVGGGGATADGLIALHAAAPTPAARMSPTDRQGRRLLNAASPVTARPPAAKLSRRLAGGAAQRTDDGRRAGLRDARQAASPIGGGGASRDGGATACGPGNGATGGADTTRRQRRAGGADACHGEAGSDGCAGAELRAAGDQSVGDAGSEDRQGRATPAPRGSVSARR